MPEGLTANPNYAAFQIAKALTTSETHDDPATRERAREKVNRWAKVLEGMFSGQLAIGSRQPIQGTPVWATPEVVTGGFVTGHLLAGGPLLPHEQEQLKRIGSASGVAERQTLNAYFITEVGLAELTERLLSGCYEVTIPEEAALLVVAWLAANGHAENARQLLDIISPHFATLRFHPIPTQRPASFGARVFLESVGTTLERVRRIRPNPHILAQREAIHIWTPLYDRMVRLFLETMSGDIPAIQPDSEGRWISPDTKKFSVVGGWPCQRYAAGWKEQAQQALADCEQARSLHALCGKPARTGDSFARLRGYLKRCVEKPESLTGRDVGMIRLILARHVTKRGEPDSEKFRQIHERQAEQAAGPAHHEIASVIQHRLASYPPEAGLEILDSIIQPVTADDGHGSQVPPGTVIPPSICRKVSRCLCETADVLVERGIITSSEILARVIPQFTSGLWAVGFADPHLRNLYAAIYRAFRRRRSLLLLNLESQVRIEELPWVAAMERFRSKDLSARELSRQTLKEVAVLTIRAFPHAILPNKLLQEMRSLAKGAELNLPLVEELAADIFMDDFSPKFTEAAKQAAELLEGSLYARYFGIDCAAVRRLPETKSERIWLWFRKEASPNPLVELCIARAGVTDAARGDVARNGMVIEQAQILTTQNLAVLSRAFNLGEELRHDLRDMAERCFKWICRRQQAKTDNWHATLIMLKNTAYAWRQMVFYLSHVPSEDVRVFLEWADEHLHQQADAFRIRFSPALRGLAAAHAGHSLDDRSQSACRFLGWTKTRHWLLGEASAQTNSRIPDRSHD